MNLRDLRKKRALLPEPVLLRLFPKSNELDETGWNELLPK